MFGSFGYDMVRPFLWSGIRHAVTAGVAFVAAKGILVDEATANGAASVAMQAVDFLVAGGVGGIASVATSFFKKRA